MNNLQLRKLVTEWIGLIGAIGFLSALCLLGYQGVYWLRHGDWVSLPLSLMLEHFEIDHSALFGNWYGLNKIANFVLDVHLGIAILTLTVLLSIIVLNLVGDNKT